VCVGVSDTVVHVCRLGNNVNAHRKFPTLAVADIVVL